MPRKTPVYPRCHKTLLALAAGAALAPHAAWALTLSQSPPGSVEPFVRPNVIISIDDSGSMDYRVDSESTSGATNNLVPNPDGSWPMSSRRMNVLKYTLRSIFDPADANYDATLLPDKKIRLAWQVMHNNGSAPDAKNVDSATMKTNSMRVLQNPHRANFLGFVNSLKPKNATPSHLMFSQADAYMRQPLGASSAWASEPGTTAAPYLGCRRSYHIMMTDGRWNSNPTGGQRDGVNSLTLPDGTVYADGSAAQNAKVALYRDPYSNTLADWAFRSWSTALQPAASLSGTMQPTADYRNAASTENFGNDSAGNPAILERYWNPRYNPATWAHMITYTIGFSNVAAEWPGAPNIVGPTEKVPFGYDGSFADLVTGNKEWPDMGTGGEPVRALDLWHAAINGRGKFFAVTKGEDLVKAFRSIFGQINTQTDPNLATSAASGANISLTSLSKYTSGYDPEKAWKGFVVADDVKPNGSIVPNPGWGGKTTADKLDEATFSVGSRLVLSWSNKIDANGKQKGGVPFQWASDESNLSTAQKLWLQKNIGGTDQGATMGQNRLDFIRGERGMEGSDAGGYPPTKPFRARFSRQGDSVNSVVWFTGKPVSNYALKGYAKFTRDYETRTPMIYLGANDGMLHGFSAADGTEKIAYVPKGVIPSLSQLTDPGYNNSHKFFVDGSPMTGDIDMGAGVQDPDDPNYNPAYTPGWRTVLVGTLGRGGKGYFVLDVTNPNASNDANGALGFTAGNALDLVKLDRSRGAGEPTPDCVTGLNSAQQTACNNAWTEDKDIGHITAQPVLDDTNPMRTTQITRMNDNRWAVVLGNGYNSTNQRPVLLIQYLDGAMELKRIVAAPNDAPGTGNAADNGLAAPRLMDLNGDGRPDVAYAGDNLGNMWKFDLTSQIASQWNVAFGGAPLFTARGPASLGSASRTKVQPITAPPTVRANDRSMTIGTGPGAKTVSVGGMMVAFGTGRNVTKDDEATVDVQTLYSVLDNTRYETVTTNNQKRLKVHPGGGTCPNGPNCVPAPAPLGTGVTIAKLAQQKITELNGGDLGSVDTVTELNKTSWASHNGWYMDLPAVGERLLKPMEFYDGSNLLTVWSQVPAKGSNVDPNIETCEANSVDEERQWRTFINIMDGKRPSIQIMDSNGNSTITLGDDGGKSRKKVTKGPHTLVAKDKLDMLDVDAKNNTEVLKRMPEQSMRPSWRQVR